MSENKVTSRVDYPKVRHTMECTKIDCIASRVLQISNISSYLSVVCQLSQYYQLC
jgi:hypothetical protein